MAGRDKNAIVKTIVFSGICTIRVYFSQKFYIRYTDIIEFPCVSGGRERERVNTAVSIILKNQQWKIVNIRILQYIEHKRNEHAFKRL